MLSQCNFTFSVRRKIFIPSGNEACLVQESRCYCCFPTAKRNPFQDIHALERLNFLFKNRFLIKLIKNIFLSKFLYKFMKDICFSFMKEILVTADDESHAQCNRQYELLAKIKYTSAYR